MARSICTVCGTLATRGSRCARHPERSGANGAVHRDPRWARLSHRMLARNVGEYGRPTCVGDGPDHPAHPTTDPTLDHVVQLQEGGAPFDASNTRVLCRSRNSENGARLANERRAGRIAPRRPAPMDERAQIRARFLG